MPKPYLSVVIPAYNEQERFTKTLPQILKYFKQQKFSWEVVIVDDGSKDKTVSLVEGMAKVEKNLYLYKQSNTGKGGALRTGFAQSKGDWVLFMDADLSTPLGELDKFWEFAKKYPVIIGSRKMAGANVKKRQSFIRENLGKVFTLLTNLLATGNISDVTCGFKLYKGPVGRTLFKTSQLNDWSFDAEILFLAKKFGYEIKEVPVTWKDDPRTKVSMLKDGLRALQGLFKIRLLDLQGAYTK